jgi:hypothetical protein
VQHQAQPPDTTGPAVPRNIEIKAKVEGLDTVLPRARALAGAEPTLIEQDDTFFRVPHGRLKLRQFADGSAELIHYHRDGTRTESIKDGTGTRIKEKTYSENSILSFVREFETDSKGRLRNGVIYDGRKNVLGSMVYGYDATTDQIVEERLFNAKGQIIRRLFYPGALKDPRFTKRFVAFNYDPDNPDAKPVAEPH